MNIEDILSNHVQAQRNEEMKTSQQLTLGELILKLEAIENKEKPIIFDDGKYRPTDIMASWRGSYCEIAIEYEKQEESTPLTASAFLKSCKGYVGATLYGYKGGEFLMGKTTPVWVANYGESHGFRRKGNIDTQVVIDVTQDETSVILVTQNIDY